MLLFLLFAFIRNAVFESLWILYLILFNFMLGSNPGVGKLCPGAKRGPLSFLIQLAEFQEIILVVSKS